MSLLSEYKVYVIGGNYGIERIFRNRSCQMTDNIGEASIVVWTGGADVTPALYGERAHPSTHNDVRRDKWEKACYEQARKGKKLLVGICRGGQFLNVMNGGSLWQDVDNHAIRGEHVLLYEDRVSPSQSIQRYIKVNSTHHQMMIPNSRAMSVVWGRAGETTRKSSGALLKDDQGLFSIHPKDGHMSDCEIVYYPITRSLCFQPHPEYDSKTTHDLFFSCIDRALAA